MMMKHLSLPFALCAAVASFPLAAQIGMTDLNNYPSYEPGAAVKDGYTAEDLRGTEIRGKNGQTIGQIDDLIIGPDNKLKRVLVPVNEGFLGIGGRMLVIGFDELKPGARDNGNVEYFTAPVTKNNVEEHGLFKDKSEAGAGRREWRATELLGDYASLKDQNEYGIVRDLMFDKSGQLRGVAISPDFRGSALPFWTAYSGNDKGWDPGDNYYVLPYSTSEIAKLLPNQQGKQTRVSEKSDDTTNR